MDQIGPNWPKNRIFLSFLKFTTLDFADFAYSSSVPLCLTAGLTKRPEKNVKAQNLGLTVPKRSQNGPKTYFLRFGRYILLLYMKTKRLAWKKIKKYFWILLPFLGPPFSQKSHIWTENGQKSILG